MGWSDVEGKVGSNRFIVDNWNLAQAGSDGMQHIQGL